MFWLVCFSQRSLFCIQLRHSTCDGIGVIATLGLLLLALETPWEMWGVGSATLGQRWRCPRVPVLGEFLLLHLVFLAKQI